MHRKTIAGAALAALFAAPAFAQADAAGWQACATIGNDTARLACFDAWSGRQAMPAAAPAVSAPAPARSVATATVPPRE